MNCPQCKADIPASQINISANIAQCTQCNYVFKISEHISASSPVDNTFNRNEPPKGAWIKSDFTTMTLGATTRSWFALFLIPFMVVWSGFSLGGIYGTQFASGNFDTLSSLFGIPFILGSIIFWALGLMFVFGKVEITLTTEGGKIFTGIGIIGKTQRFEWSEINNIYEDVSYNSKRQAQHIIVIEGKTRLTFGSLLSEERRYYILKSLQQVFNKKEMNRGFI